VPIYGLYENEIILRGFTLNGWTSKSTDMEYLFSNEDIFRDPEGYLTKIEELLKEHKRLGTESPLWKMEGFNEREFLSSYELALELCARIRKKKGKKNREGFRDRKLLHHKHFWDRKKVKLMLAKYFAMRN
jgi:hypothetical protein